MNIRSAPLAIALVVSLAANVLRPAPQISGDVRRFLSAISVEEMETGAGTVEVFRITGNVQVVNGLGATATANGSGNLIVGYLEDPQFNPVNREGSHCLVVGPRHSYAAAASGSVLFGVEGRALGPNNSILGGRQNATAGSYACVVGGSENAAAANGAVVSGGHSNEAIGGTAWVGGGEQNVAAGASSSVTGGGGNRANGPYSSVCGGTSNVADANNSTVSGGYDRTASGVDDWVAGGLLEDQ